MNKRFIFSAANLLLRPLFNVMSPKDWLKSRSRRLGLRYVDIGGMWPAEGYVSVRLSPYDFYGVPTPRWSSKLSSLIARVVRSFRRKTDWDPLDCQFHLTSRKAYLFTIALSRASI